MKIENIDQLCELTDETNFIDIHNLLDIIKSLDSCICEIIEEDEKKPSVHLHKRHIEMILEKVYQIDTLSGVIKQKLPRDLMIDINDVLYGIQKGEIVLSQTDTNNKK